MFMKRLFSTTDSQNGILATLWDYLTSPSTSLSSLEERRAARLAASFLFAIALLDIVGGVARLPRWGVIGAFSGSLGFSLVTTLLGYVLSRTKWYRAAIFLFSLGFGFSAHFSILVQGNDADFSALVLVYIPLSLIVASSFLSSWAVLLLTGLNIAALLSLSMFGVVLLPDNIGAQAGIILTIGIVLILLANFRKNLEQARLAELQEINRALEESRDHLEERVAERTRAAEIARADAELARAEAEAQAWFTSGQAQLSEKMRGEQDIPTLANNVISFLSQYVGAQTGALFLLSGDVLKLMGRYAYADTGQKSEFRLGEGVVGEVAKSRHEIKLITVPEDAALISSALGNARPKQLLVAPIEVENHIFGVVELGTLTEFTADHQAFLHRVSENVAIAIRTAQTRITVNDLLAQSQSQSE